MSEIKTKLGMLNEQLDIRVGEIASYQTNIDNFLRAIKKIETFHSGDTFLDIEMCKFKDHLEKLLSQHYVEQRKSQIMLEVIQDQINELNTEKKE
jgi:hypothetical protein